MCGIGGFYGFEDDQLIKNISLALKHRGPDGEGIYTDKQATLLNRRLAIIDRAGGDQPIFNEDQSLVVVYNGEIYNYQDLRTELIKKGHRFKTNSDTEVIIHAYEQWGVDVFDRFNGMFAFCLYEIKNNKMILVRDHFGIKPLHYSIISRENLKLIFSSEIKPIFFSRLIAQEPNDRIIYRYLNFRVHNDQPETFFKDIYQLMPGEMMIIENNHFEIKKYTRLEKELLNNQKTRLTKDDARKFYLLLEKAVKIRLVSEVPVGSCLSGGLDSSSVVAVINQLIKKQIAETKLVGQKQKTFSAVFPKGNNNESAYIDELVRKITVNSFKTVPTPKKFFDDLTDFVKTQEEPTISTGPYAQYEVMKLAKDRITVLLDGQGADEVLAGYYPYYFVYWRQLLKEKKYLRLLIELINSGDILWRFFFDWVKVILGFKKSLKPERLLKKDFQQRFKDEHFPVTNDSLKKRLIADTFYHSLPALLRYEDRNSMRFSIEGRVPFLDPDLIRFIFSKSDDAIINSGWNKYLLRRAMKEQLPKKIVERRNKIGFTTPEHQWFLALKEEIFKIFLSKSFAQRRYFNQREVLLAFQQFIDGQIDDTLIFWRLLNLELWLREFFDKKDSQTLSVNRKRSLDGPNRGKKLTISVNKKKYFRYPIRTDLIKKEDDLIEKINSYSLKTIDDLNKVNPLKEKKFFLVVSEKIVAITQGRSYFIWEIKPSLWANLLSKFVKKTPYGIGLGSPWTMELAIRETGLWRVLLASLAAILTKPLGITGVFYRVAGRAVAAIDGPTEYSVYPSNISAKLPPKDPLTVCRLIDKAINRSLNSEYSSLKKNFLGSVIIDANDLGQTVLANTTSLNRQTIEKIFQDNPMGQSDEMTPLVLVIF